MEPHGAIIISLKITHLKFSLNLPGASELNTLK